MGLLKALPILAIVLSAALLSDAQRFRFFRRAGKRNDESGSGQPAQPAFSGFPVPNGPFYGQPFDLSATMAGRLPFTVSGVCEEGKVYNITKTSDLLNYKTELECIHSAGLAPTKVPEGAFHGSIISLINSQVFNEMFSKCWTDKTIKNVQCNGNESYIGWNNVQGQPISPFVANIQPLDLNFAPGEYYDGKDSLVVDYTQDLSKVCPDYQHVIRTNRVNTEGNVHGQFPLNQMVDSFRFVGKQEDGASIYLGKTFMKDYYRSDLQAATFAYWYAVNNDEKANTAFKSGDSLPPTETKFKYMHPGVTDFILRVLPFDNLLTHPFGTVDKFVRGALKQAQNRSPFNFINLGQNGNRNFMRNPFRLFPNAGMSMRRNVMNGQRRNRNY